MPSTNPNPYRSPDSSLVGERPSGDGNLPLRLRRQRTWSLVLLTVITYGVYAAHYAQTQSRVINAALPENRHVSHVLIGVFNHRINTLPRRAGPAITSPTAD